MPNTCHRLRSPSGRDNLITQENKHGKESGQHGGNVLQMAEQYGLTPDSILDFSANINPLGMPSSLKQAIINNLDLAEHYPDIDYQRLHDTHLSYRVQPPSSSGR